jgi:hypothetical protein
MERFLGALMIFTLTLWIAIAEITLHPFTAFHWLGLAGRIVIAAFIVRAIYREYLK